MDQGKLTVAEMLLRDRQEVLRKCLEICRSAAMERLSNIRDLIDDPVVKKLTEEMEADIQTLCDCFESMSRESSMTIERLQ